MDEMKLDLLILTAGRSVKNSGCFIVWSYGLKVVISPFSIA
jgi:hypothetical protein